MDATNNGWCSPLSSEINKIKANDQNNLADFEAGLLNRKFKLMKWIPQLIIIVLSALLAYLQKHSIAITYSSEIEGSSCCFFCDSFGNRFELMEYEVSEKNT